MWLLPWLPRLSGWVVHSMHRITAIEGTAPQRGPVILTANHPSGLIDPLVVTIAAGRPVRWLAKSTLVFHPVLGPLFRAAGCIPVFRRQDDAARMDRNAESFRAVVQALAGGAAVAVFPEGITHAEPDLAPLKTGAARLALSAAKTIGGSFPIVPVGVIYRDAPTFRSEAGVVVGTPVEWADLAGRDPEDRDATQQLTSRIAASLNDVTRGLSTWADQVVVEHAAAVLAAESAEELPPPSWIARASRLLARLEAAQDPSLPDLRGRVRRHARALARLRVPPSRLAGRDSPAPPLWRGWRAPVAAVLWVIGLVWTWPPYRLTGIVATRLATEREVLGTAKAATGLVLFAIWIGLTAALAGLAWGWIWGLMALPAGIGLALVTLQLEEARIAGASDRRLARWRRRGSEALVTLAEEQRDLARELAAVVERMESGDQRDSGPPNEPDRPRRVEHGSFGHDVS